MGIERFFSSIESNKITNLKMEFSSVLERKIATNYLLIDFNSIIYSVKARLLYEINTGLYNIIKGKFPSKLEEKYDLKSYGIELSKDITPEQFNRMFDNDTMNKIIIDNVIFYVMNILENYIDSNHLNVFYISIDGVPSKSKLIEQKKRRYMGSVIMDVESLIFKKHEGNLSPNKDRYTYEKLKINWKTHNITPGTIFMDQLNTILSSTDFEVNIKKICKHLKTYIFSGPYEPGEGEFKIVNYLRELDMKEIDDKNFVIYSPDSDVTLLSLLLNCRISPTNDHKISNLKLLRYNQQQSIYNVVDIDKLSINIFTYVLKNIEDMTVVKDHIINDIVFLLSIFGNDFIPKIESFNVKYDFNRIIDKYIELFKSKKDYIINYDKDVRIINYSILLEMIKLLQIDEGGNLQKNYMSSQYRNYNKLKTILGTNQENFTKVLNEFLNKLRKLNSDIRSGIDFIFEENKDFIKIMNKLTKFPSKVNDEEFLENYKQYYQENKKFPKVFITFQRVSRTIKDDYHRTTLEKSLDHLDPNLKITKYDEEVYQLNRMLDDYVKKLNSSAINLGYITLDPTTYVLKSEPIIKGINRYYKDYFEIDDLKGSKMKSVAHSYVEGLIWVFEYYFNNYNEKNHRLYANTWFYKYSKAPLLTQIYHYLRDNQKEVINIKTDLQKYTVNREDYFNCLEQLMYVTPKNILAELAPEEYQKVLTSYIDTDNISEKIWNSEENNEIDCRGVTFITKCHLHVLEDIENFSSDKTFIKQLRAIKLDPETNKRKGIIYEHRSNVHVITYNNYTTMKKVSKNELSSKVNDETSLYKLYKKQYYKTKDIKYKRLYKQIKHQKN